MLFRETTWQRWRFCLLATVVVVIVGPSQLFAVTIDKLRDQARIAISQKLTSIDPPTIRFEGGELQYYLGGVGPFFNEQFHNQLLGHSLGNEIQVEVLRSLRRGRLDNNFWDPLLSDVESIIGDQLKLADGSAETLEMRKMQFDDLDVQMWTTYKTAFDREAQRRGLVAAPLAARGGPKQVQLKTDPPGAKIFLMHVLEKQMADLEGRPAAWQEIEDPTQVTVDGSYWYALQRGDQTTAGAMPIDFNRAEDQLEYTLQ